MIQERIGDEKARMILNGSKIASRAVEEWKTSRRHLGALVSQLAESVNNDTSHH